MECHRIIISFLVRILRTQKWVWTPAWYAVDGVIPFNHHNQKSILLINYTLSEREKCEWKEIAGFGVKWRCWPSNIRSERPNERQHSNCLIKYGEFAFMHNRAIYCVRHSFTGLAWRVKKNVHICIENVPVCMWTCEWLGATWSQRKMGEVNLVFVAFYAINVHVHLKNFSERQLWNGCAMSLGGWMSE